VKKNLGPFFDAWGHPREFQREGRGEQAGNLDAEGDVTCQRSGGNVGRRNSVLSAIPFASMKIITCLIATLSLLTTARAERPNILLVVSDDLGYGDLACFGAKDVKTPNLDKFASESLKLTSYYAAHPNCSPSRTGLMTGRNPTRVGVRDWIPEESPIHMRKSEITIATLLRNAGYATCQSGKWHMNGGLNLKDQPQPGDHGFEHWFATQNNAYPNHHNPDNFVRDGQEVGKLDGFAAHLVADEALRWLTGLRDKSKPFFLYVAFHEPHEPIASDEEYLRLYPSDDPSWSDHHANITQMDAAFGRLMRALDDQKLRDSTLVFFNSDNGPAITSQHPHGSSGPLRDKKGSVYEGGIRVPGMVRWPGKTKPDTASDVPVCGVDFLPTVCAIVGIAPPADRVLDGANLLPMLSGDELQRKTPLYWHFNRASGGPQVAMREGDWKILATIDKPAPARSSDITEETEHDFKTAEMVKFELYNLRNDIGETKDLSTQEAARLAEMKSVLEKKYHEVREEAPTWPAWKNPGTEGKRIVWPDYVKKPKAKAAPTK
jgi:arylsulfatase A